MRRQARRRNQLQQHAVAVLMYHHLLEHSLQTWMALSTRTDHFLVSGEDQTSVSGGHMLPG